MATDATGIEIPRPVADKLKQVRRLKTVVRVGATVVGAGAVLLMAMLLAMGVDWLAMPTGTTARVLLTNTALLAAVGALGVGLWWALFRGRQLPQVAREVDRAVPRLEERWSTVAELHHAPRHQQAEVHPAMIGHVAHEARHWEPHIEPQDIVSPRQLLRAFVALGVALFVLVAVFVADWRMSLTLMHRFLAPRANVTFTQLDRVSGDLVAARGEPVELSATLHGRRVDEAWLAIRPSSGDLQRVLLVPRGDAQNELTHRIRAADQPFAYQFEAGDGRSPWHQVDVATRPEFSQVEFHVTPPQYTGRAAQQLATLPPSATIVEGSTLQLGFTLKQPAETFHLRLGGDRLEQLTADEAGWYRWQSTITESMEIAPHVVTPQGLAMRHPPVCNIHVYRDRAPVVNVVNPTDEIAVQAEDTIDIRFEAEDDFAIGRAELLVTAHPAEGAADGAELQVIEIPLGEQTNAKRITGSVALDLSQYELEDGREVSYSVRVYDTRQTPNTASTAEDATAADDPSSLARSGATSSPSALTSQEQRPADDATSHETLAEQDQGASGDQPTPTGAELAADAASREQQSASEGNDSDADGPPTSPDVPMADNEAAAGSAGETNGELAMPAGAQLAEQRDNPDARNESPASAPRPADGMTRRMLDMAQSATSNQQRLRIDQWAGSFEGQEREKMALAIAPVLEDIDKHLQRAQQQAGMLVDHFKTDAAWQGEQDRAVGRTDEALELAQRTIGSLNRKSEGTPYAFVGLQLVDIDQAHINPARDALWATLQADKGREQFVREAWLEIGRARSRLAGLVERFERIRRDHRLADSLQRVKKMYQVFVEDAFTMLGHDPARINNYQREIMEFDLDDEYLSRLQEVLEMRRQLMAEFAHILAEDPRLLRRYMDRFVDRQDSLRDQLTLLAVRQQRLAREVRAWTEVEENGRATLLQAITAVRVAEATEISEEAGRLAERFDAWLPLDMEVREGELAAARDAVLAVAASAAELVAPGTDDSGSGPLAALATQGRQTYEQVNEFEAALRQVTLSGNHPQLTGYVINRLAESRQLVERTSAWVRKLEELEADKYHRAAAVEQHQLAVATQNLAAAMANVDSQISGLLENANAEVASELADKGRQLLALFDNQLSPNQLGATYSLRHDRLPTAVTRQTAAVEAFAEAERLFDEMIQQAIKELDKLPVQDPIASLLDDPTLDELLAQLENEQQLAAALGIPPRPSNLRIIGDWLSPQRDGGIAAQMRLLAATELRQDEKEAERKMQQAYEKALARALKEMQEALKKSQAGKGRARQQNDWNTLVSQLRDDLAQDRGAAPPEQYRRAIEQYFDLISRARADEGD